MYTLCVETNLRKNGRNLGSLVIIGPLWVKYGGKTACQPPAAQNPGHAPEKRLPKVKNITHSQKIIPNISKVHQKLI